MAVSTINVSGVAGLRVALTANTQFYFTNAADGQKLTLILQQPPSGTGPFTVSSGNCPGIMQPSASAGDDTTQLLVYDSATNTWNGVPQQLSPGSLILNTTTTNTAIAWAKGTWVVSGAATMTVTNPVAGPPGIGNDGEIMTFISQAASAVKVTMTVTQSINGTSTSIITAGANGDAISLQAWGGNVYTAAVTGAFTLS